ncbi:DUF6611 family protein [Gordonia aichiensis]|uniref:Uncharacterized protein n=1 Tax=Gordonia aichiensis NBRC 108223 TaxID=1220583 RepID=L7KN71_9ACTN|nr:DUF6611 family protein [Gordonia aichiensis]GAC50054.1 hypothetical protein GOACH_19_00580 [Gordonia aichiensis NBRC 108223]
MSSPGRPLGSPEPEPEPQRKPCISAETSDASGSVLIDRLAEGPSVWGSFSAGTGRFGVCRYRLVVFPPGVNSMQRRRLRLWRGWPVWGPLVWLAVAVGLSACGASGPVVLAAATTVFVVSGVAARRAAGRLPATVRTVDLTTIPGYDIPEGMPTPRSIANTVSELRSADRRLARGAITPVEHEVVWQRVYDSLPPRRRRPPMVARR